VLIRLITRPRKPPQSVMVLEHNLSVVELVGSIMLCQA